jgi:lysyl-tRNA synthetase class 2
MNILELSEQEIVRREALAELRNLGIEPYPAAEYPTNAFSTDIIAEFKDEEELREVCIACSPETGRLFLDVCKCWRKQFPY